jgi:hypothetical protein
MPSIIAQKHGVRRTTSLVFVVFVDSKRIGKDGILNEGTVLAFA